MILDLGEYTYFLKISMCDLTYYYPKYLILQK